MGAIQTATYRASDLIEAARRVGDARPTTSEIEGTGHAIPVLVGPGATPELFITRHSLVNMLIPVITVIGLQAGQLLGGAVIVETVFAWPGVGRLLVDAISNRDYPLVQAAVIFITLGFIAIRIGLPSRGRPRLDGSGFLASVPGTFSQSMLPQ